MGINAGVPVGFVVSAEVMAAGTFVVGIEETFDGVTVVVVVVTVVVAGFPKQYIGFWYASVPQSDCLPPQ
jgi:hypothetical protein